jgi:hypothetical protein
VRYEAVTRCDGAEIKVPLKDFATQIGVTGRDRAETMCAALNGLRAKALNLSESALRELPAGLVVAQMPTPKQGPFDPAKSIVQRL